MRAQNIIQIFHTVEDLLLFSYTDIDDFGLASVKA